MRGLNGYPGSTRVIATVNPESVVNPDLGCPDTAAFPRLIQDALQNLSLHGIPYETHREQGWMQLMISDRDLVSVVQTLADHIAINGKNIWEIVCYPFGASDALTPADILPKKPEADIVSPEILAQVPENSSAAA